MYSHIVLYETNPKNPAATAQIVANAKALLRPITDSMLLSTLFHVGTIQAPARAVERSRFSVMLNLVFGDETAYQSYMKDHRHMEFVRFVLRGWILKGDSGIGAGDRFIEHILHCSPDDRTAEKTRDPLVPECNVVWADEQVTNAHG